MTIAARLDDIGKPAWIALMIAGFVVWWPIGLVTLGFLIGSGRIMGCWTQRRHDRWQRRMQEGMERMRQGAGGPGHRGADRAGAPRAARPRAATPPLTNTAARPCAASKTSSAISWNFSTACARRRTRRSSTSSWPSAAAVTTRRRPSSRRPERSRRAVGLVVDRGGDNPVGGYIAAIHSGAIERQGDGAVAVYSDEPARAAGFRQSLDHLARRLRERLTAVPHSRGDLEGRAKTHKGFAVPGG